MEPQRDLLRDHLLAVIEAAPELPRDSREHLADVFLDELNTQFQLVPRSRERRRGDEPQAPAVLYTARRRWPAIAAGFALLLLLPSLLWLAGVPMSHWYGYHPPFFLVPVLFVYLMTRVFGPWPSWRSGRYGSR